MKQSRSILVFGGLLAGIIVVVLMATIAPKFFNLQPPSSQATTPTQSANPMIPGSGGSPAATPKEQTFFIARAFEDASANATLVTTLEIFQRLLLAVVLSGILAFRPRKNVPLFKRSLFVSQTQILLSVVAAALMLIVGDNTARAFAIFAAVSLVRFRTNIRDPKEITVLLISLALGLASGVGRWDLGIVLCLFALALLWLLEFKEPEQAFRSMDLTVKTRNPDKTQSILKKIFKRMRIDAEVREIVPPDEKKQMGTISYYLNMRLSLTTDELSDRILASDPNNIEGMQWSKSKSAGDIYN
ncbi:MAG TPA: DUF4956 domain-containing protein [Pyrinomonadaceae bacterium]|jgi:uncharacterized membrane protein YhiD involved in acid resistance|nr:DUF4956 domain-containing protein [Pyrinomonadaceae bacterium]